MVEPKFDIVRFAVKLEREAHDLYAAIKEKAVDENTKKLCRTLAEEELRHERMLQELGTQDLSALNEKLKRIGAFNLQFIDTMEGDYDSSELEDMLKFALKLEVEASMRYRELSKKASGTASKLFSDLAGMEENHIEMIKWEMVRLGLRKDLSV